MLSKWVCFLICCASLSAFADLVDGKTLAPVTIESVTETLNPGSILIVSELHGFAPHQANQLSAMTALSAHTDKVSAGLEFFEKPYQNLVDQFTAGHLDEADFLKQIGWGSIPFSFYKDQALYPAAHGGFTVALNAPRALTSKISKNGLDSLTPDERLELPSHFELGNDGYLERFKEVMGEHVTPDKITNYFAAQSAWDEVMSSTALSFLDNHPEQTLVIIVGDFHAAYGGGLPDRLRARGVKDLRVISQIDATGLTEDETKAMVAPDPKWGPRADYVWIHQ